tara:strand:- start:1849 stop:2121 length:273 start_codon:yes stop_codon:yes gene_type:complete
MRKKDYLTLTHTLRADITELRKQREKQLSFGMDYITAPVNTTKFNESYAAVKALEQRIDYIKLLANGLSMSLSVDRKEFLAECGIYSGAV